jgi:hypothetical protein
MWDLPYLAGLAPMDLLALSGGLAIWIRRRGSLEGWLGSAAFFLAAVTWGLRALLFDSDYGSRFDLMRADPYLHGFWLPSLGLVAHWCVFGAIVTIAVGEVREPGAPRGPFPSTRWLARILGPLGFAIVLNLVLERMLEQFGLVTAVLALLNLVALIVGVVYLAKFIYRIWAAIQDGPARTTPGRAVGFLFIPVFNLYWIFVAYWGWAKDFNRYVEEKGLPAPRVHQKTTLALCILALVAMVP